MRRRIIPGNARTVTTVVCGADAQSQALAASMAMATLPFSPMAVGVHSPGASPHGFVGDAGYGVSRFAGRTLPYQHYAHAIAPVAKPLGKQLGYGAGVAGQPGYPNTGTGPTNPLIWVSAFQVGPGMSG